MTKNTEKPPRLILLVLALALTAGSTACREAGAASDKSFNEIKNLVEGKSAAEVLRLLGEPDTHQAVFGSDERWIWWSYTFLSGKEHPPEVRGRVVHLEIVFRRPDRPSSEPLSYVDWQVDEPLGVSFKIPSSDGK